MEFKPSSTTIDDKKIGNRKPVPHTINPTASILNALPVVVAEQIYNRYKEGAEASGDCLFPRFKVPNGKYPRVKLTLNDAESLPNDLRDLVKMNRNRGRISLHQAAWRAMGHEIPDFESGLDISHTCRRGQMRTESKTSVRCDIVKYGCFSKTCLELTDHRSNLRRGNCPDPIECPRCHFIIDNCGHAPKCKPKIVSKNSTSTRTERESSSHLRITSMGSILSQLKSEKPNN